MKLLVLSPTACHFVSIWSKYSPRPVFSFEHIDLVCQIWGFQVTMKNGIFWDVTPCGSCNNRRFGGT
jgi:hypothetical protein